MAARNDRNKWYRLKMANKIPQLEFEKEMDAIGRVQATIKRDTQYEEGRIWKYLFNNYRVLKGSDAGGDFETFLKIRSNKLGQGRDTGTDAMNVKAEGSSDLF